MAADTEDVSEEFTKDKLSTALNTDGVNEMSMEVSKRMDDSVMESTENDIKAASESPPTALQVHTRPHLLEPMEVDPISNSESTILVEMTENGGLNQTDDDQNITDLSTSQNDLNSSGGNVQLTRSKQDKVMQPTSSAVTHVEVTEDSKSTSMDEVSRNTLYPPYVNTLAEAEEVLHHFETNTKTRFCVWRAPKDFGDSTIDLKGKRIYWHEFDIEDRITIKSDGIPFFMMGRKVYDCHHGRDRNIASKEKAKLKRQENEVKRRNVTIPSRKVDCPARIVFCEIIYFPDYKTVADTKYHRNTISKTIRQDFASGTVNLKNTERRIYLSFPTEKDHKGHPMNTEEMKGVKFSQRVHPKVSHKISQLVAIGIRSEKEMKQHVDYYIARELFPGRARPFHSNRRFYPTKSVIRIKMYNAYIKKRLEAIDLENIEEGLGQWRNNSREDMFHFRRYADIDEIQSQGTRFISVEEENEEELKIKQKIAKQQFLFVQQTSFQNHLLKRYGNLTCFLDPAYRTTKYVVPMFFITVKTNIDYQIAASFFLQDESKDSIREALEMLKSWNPEWKPKVFMLDNDDDEMATVKECFPGCKVLLSDFHREQAWERWLSIFAHDMMPHRDAILGHLRMLAQASSTDEFEEALEKLEESDVWKSNYGKEFREWFENSWLSVKEHWVLSFTLKTLTSVVTTNNTIEWQNREFNHEQLVAHGDTKLSEVLNMLLDSILPAKQEAYCKQNDQLPTSLTKYGNLPAFFHDKPQQLADHIAECITSSHDITPEDIVVNSSSGGEFLVKSCDSDIEYKVHFGNSKKLPHCQCKDWSKTLLPCKHFVAIMRDFREWNWSNFPKSYRSSPYLTLDEIVKPSSTEGNPNSTEVNPTDTEVNPNATEVNPNATDVNPNATEVNPNATEGNPNATEGNPNAAEVNSDATEVNPSQSDTLDLSEIQGLQKVSDRSMASVCRDVLSEINNVTYTVYDRSTITTLYETLNELLANLKLSVVDDDLIMVENETDARKVKSDSKKVNERKPRTWTTTPLKRGKRTGESAGQGVAGIDVAHKSAKLDPGPTGSIPSEILEEHVLEEMNHMDLLNIDYYRPLNSEGTPGNAADIQGHSENAENNSLLFNVSPPGDPQAGSALDLAELNDKKNGEEALLYSSTPSGFSKYEESLVLRNEMVTHESINLAQRLLRDAFPHLKGFQNVARGAVQAFEPVSGDFIQILHDGNFHWVCTSNVSFGGGKDPAALTMYDSMNQGYVAKFTKQQLASFLCIQSPELKVIMKSVQQQANAVDCGVFAIAFATSIAFGEDPSMRHFDVSKMRNHLFECLQSKIMSPFPEMKVGAGDIVLSKRKFYTVELFCSCRMPYEKPKSEADLMAQCGGCKEWFHQRCEKIALEIFKTSGINFFCSSCLKRV